MQVSEPAKELDECVQSNKHSCYSCGAVTQGNNSLCETCSDGWSSGQ